MAQTTIPVWDARIILTVLPHCVTECSLFLNFICLTAFMYQTPKTKFCWYYCSMIFETYVYAVIIHIFKKKWDIVLASTFLYPWIFFLGKKFILTCFLWLSITYVTCAYIYFPNTNIISYLSIAEKIQFMCIVSLHTHIH